MELSRNFQVSELMVTETGLYNTPGQAELEKLLFLATYILQPIRNVFGPIKVTSGFRCKQVNERIGGAKNSQHVFGEAADFIPLQAPLEDVFAWIKDNLVYGQVILEDKNGKRWIHVSLPRIARGNMQAMTYKNGVYENV